VAGGCDRRELDHLGDLPGRVGHRARHCPRKRAALRAHWLDVAIVVLTIPLLGKVFAWFRLARFFRLLRFGVIVSRALQTERRLTSGDSLRIASILTVTAIIVAGAAQAAASSDFDSLWDGVWWAIETVSTVGYGDIYPATVQGRLIALILMFVGIGFLFLHSRDRVTISEAGARR
jgi:voltage-gated potassium channel